MIGLKFNENTRQTDITVSFVADEGVSKPDLTPAVVNNHLLTQAAGLLAVAADNVLNAKDAAKIDTEAAEKKAAIDAEAAKQKLAVVESDVRKPVKPALDDVI